MAALQLVAREVEVAGRRLSLLVPRSADDLLDEVLAGGGTVPPYWADLWPSARALATLLLEGEDLTGRRVLELGCGVGLPSVAALLAGADVLATDAEPAAVRIAARNARRCGGRRVATMVVDLLDPPDELLELDPFDLVLAADVLYEERLGDALGSSAATRHGGGRRGDRRVPVRRPGRPPRRDARGGGLAGADGGGAGAGLARGRRRPCACCA